MKIFRLMTALSLLATSAFAEPGPMSIQAMSDEATMEIPAALVEAISNASDSRGEMSASATLITVYTGPIIAPFTTYLKVFDPIPQSGGDYGSFKVFKIPYMMNDMPRATKVQISKNGKTIYVGFQANYFKDFNENGDSVYAKGRMITKLSVAKPATEGAIDPKAELTIRN